MIMTRVGSLKGALVGAAVGSIADDEGLSNPFAGITVDSGLGWRLPNNLAEWSLLRAATSGHWPLPNHLWLLQEPSGNPADTIATGLGLRNLTASGAVLYQQTVAPASRKFVTGTTLLTGSLANASMVSTGVRSSAVLSVCRSNTALVLRSIKVYGLLGLQQPASDKFRFRLNADIVDTTTAHSGTVQLTLMVNDITSGAVTLYTPTERLDLPFSASAGSTLTFQCGVIGEASVASFGYASAWDQTAAEITSTQAKEIMESLLATTVPWS